NGVTRSDIQKGRPQFSHYRDRNGAIPVLTAVESEASPSVKTPISGRTRLLVAGDSFFLSNSRLNQYGNRDFASLAAGWLLDQYQLLQGIGPQPVYEFKLTIPDPEFRQLQILMLGILPGAVFAIGMIVWWRRSLWEGMLSGLGYSKNSWPMRRIGEMTPFLFPEFPGRNPDSLSGAEVEARLFGVAGFLPKDPSRINAPYLNQLWDVWWRVRDEFGDFVLPRSIWRIAGMRPHNHPHRRLALVAQWLLRPDFFQSIEWWFTSAAEKNSLEMLGNALSVIAPPFWSSRFNFSRISLGVSPHLIGEARMIDLAINIILPWFWVRARAGRNQIMMDRAERLFLAAPRAEESRRLKDGRTRLMGRSDPKMLGSAADQQGLLQILRDFCAHSNALCEDCRFPSLVRSAGAGLTA
ncbi:DUF2851 family protein, partial [Verrucomicrobia bacterium]|nr:DUF2851 family protein [Verrucomicrobiota bacterium]